MLVKTNDAVAEGDVLATVEMASVITAMADLQEQIQELDEQISDAEEDEADDVIYAGVSGRVKAIFAEKDADVLDVMYEHGALALLSLDGYMAVDIQSDVLNAGESVTVILDDEEEVAGTVETVAAGVATILISDNGPEYDQKVVVFDLRWGDGGRCHRSEPAGKDHRNPER